jgi:hypothetical protein
VRGGRDEAEGLGEISKGPVGSVLKTLCLVYRPLLEGSSVPCWLDLEA